MKRHLAVFTAAAVALFSYFNPALTDAQSVWIGTSGTSSNWSDPANWQSGNIPGSGSDIEFQGNNRTTNTNDNGPTSVSSLTFDSGAASFTEQGDPLGFFGSGAGLNTVTNNSSALQTISFSDFGGFGGLTSAANNGDLTINAASGDFKITSDIALYNFSNLGGNLVFDGSHNTTVSGVIFEGALPASVRKEGTGTLELDNDNTYSGGTFINNGKLIVGSANALGTGNVSLNNNATLQTQDNVPRTFNVGGAYFQSGGTLRMQIGGTNSGVNSDLMAVTLSADLAVPPNSVTTLSLHRINNYNPAPGDMVTIITAANGVENEFTNVTNDFTGLIQPTVIYDPNDVKIEFVQGSFVLSGLTRNQTSVADELNEVASDPRATTLIAFLDTEPLAKLPHDYDLIAPEELASIYEIGFSQAVVHNDNLMRRMEDIRAGVNGFCPMGFVQQQAPIYSKDSDSKTVMDKNVAPIAAPCPENSWGVFVTGSGNFATVGNNDENASGYDISSGDVTVGADVRLGNHFAVGIDSGYSNSLSELVGNGHIDAWGPRLGGYATAYGNGLFGGKFYVDVGGNGSWNSYDTRRIGLQDKAVTGSTDGTEWNAFLAYGSDWTFGCFHVGTWSTLQYTDVQFNGFTEEGSLAPLEIQDQDEDSLRATTGFHLSFDHKFGNCGIVRPEIRAAWQHEYGDRSYPVDARFASGAGDVFTVWGPQIGRDAALIGGGLGVQWNPRVSTYVYYDGVLGRSNYDNNAISGGFALRF